MNNHLISLSEVVDSTFRPAIALAVGLPLLMLILTETLARLRRRSSPLVATVALVRNLLIPALGVFLFFQMVMELSPDHWGVRICETVVWLVGLMATLTFVNDYYFGAASETSWRARIPSLFRDLLRVGLVAIGAAIIYSLVWGQSLEGAVAALGVTSIVIGLALQEPLSNIVSGLMLMFERPVSLGDWVSVDGTMGKVVEINWRSVHIATPMAGLRIIPNSQLYKGSFNNLSRPTRMRKEMIELGFSYNNAPNHVKRVLLELLADTPGVLTEPKPAVHTVNYADSAIVYRVIFSVQDTEHLPGVRDDFMSRVWYAVKREGIGIPFPTVTQIQVSQRELDQASAESPVEHLTQFPAFKTLLEPPRDEQIEAGLRIHDFGAREVVVREGERIEGLHVIIHGEAVLSVRGGDGLPMEVARVGRGEFFGEGSVVAELPSEVTVTAVHDLRLVVASPAVMYRLIGRTPALSRQLGSLMESRRKAAAAARRVHYSESGSN